MNRKVSQWPAKVEIAGYATRVFAMRMDGTTDTDSSAWLVKMRSTKRSFPGRYVGIGTIKSAYLLKC